VRPTSKAAGFGGRSSAAEQAEAQREWESVAARFFGRYEHTLDDKGRVILPAKFRAHFQAGGYLSQHIDGCLAVWTPEAFDKQLDAQLEAQQQGREQRNLSRVLSAGSEEIEVSAAGRMAIPRHLRSYAQLDGDVLVIGAVDHVELWNPAAWDDKVRPSEQTLIDGVDPE
jgi:MraZ protein